MRSWPLLVPLVTFAGLASAAAVEKATPAPPQASPGAKAAGPEAGRPSAAPAAPAEERDPMSPPPGLAQDRALWQTMVDTQNAVVAHRDLAARQLQRLNVARYDLRLDALAKAAPAEKGEQIAKLKTRLVENWHENYRVLATPWPIHWHTGCRYQRLNLEAAIEGSIPQIKAARAEAKECLAKQTPALKAMQDSNKKLQASVAEVETVLAASPADKPDGGTSPAPGTGRPPAPEPEPPAAPKPGGK